MKYEISYSVCHVVCMLLQTNTVPVYVWNPSYVVLVILQGPIGCQSFSGFPTGETLLHRDIDLFINADVHAEISAMSWEATIQRHIEEELHGPLLEVCTFNLTASFPLLYISSVLEDLLSNTPFLNHFIFLQKC